MKAGFKIYKTNPCLEQFDSPLKCVKVLGGYKGWSKSLPCFMPMIQIFLTNLVVLLYGTFLYLWAMLWPLGQTAGFKSGTVHDIEKGHYFGISLPGKLLLCSHSLHIFRQSWQNTVRLLSKNRQRPCCSDPKYWHQDLWLCFLGERRGCFSIMYAPQPVSFSEFSLNKILKLIYF